MGFLTPWFFAGVVAVGLPIWLHLLKRHKSDPRLFPSLMFFERREQSSVVHKRLDYILLFVLRTLMILLLVLLFANPFIRRATAKASGKKLAVIAVDHSFSMRAVAGGQSRLEKAKAEALDVINSIPPTTGAEVIALGGQVQAMTQQTNDKNELKAAVAAIQPSDGRASFGELARFSRALTESTKLPLDLHLISDLQKTATPPGFTDLRLDQDTSLILHPVGGELPNWTVENVVAPRRVYDPKRVRVQATIAGFAAPAGTRTVSLVLNGKTAQTKTVNVPANGRASVEFLGLDASYGFNRGEVRIDSADALAADDRFPFSVERADPKKILFLDDGRRPKGQLYFRAALDSNADAAFTMDVQRPEAGAAANLSNYAVVVLDDPGILPGSLSDNLQHYVNNGGSVFVVLGASSAVLQKVPVTDDAIDSTRYAGRETQLFLTVADLDTGHPVLKSVERFEGVRFYQVTHVTPSKSHVLARLNDQTPLVLESQIGGGKVLVFASPFDNSVNDFPLHASFVPFVQTAAAYLGGGGAEQPVNQVVDSYVELRTGEGKNAPAEVLDQDGKRVLSLQEATTAPNYALSSEGFYEVKTASGRRTLQAVHADRRESDLSVIPNETLDLWKGTGSGATGNGANGAAAAADDQKTPWSLSPVILLLLLLVALAESAVANGYLRTPADRLEVRKEAA
jgi:hypothetical protein